MSKKTLILSLVGITAFGGAIFVVAGSFDESSSPAATARALTSSPVAQTRSAAEPVTREAAPSGESGGHERASFTPAAETVAEDDAAAQSRKHNSSKPRRARRTPSKKERKSDSDAGKTEPIKKPKYKQLRGNRATRKP